MAIDTYFQNTFGLIIINQYESESDSELVSEYD